MGEIIYLLPLIILTVFATIGQQQPSVTFLHYRCVTGALTIQADLSRYSISKIKDTTIVASLKPLSNRGDEFKSDVLSVKVFREDSILKIPISKYFNSGRYELRLVLHMPRDTFSYRYRFFLDNYGSLQQLSTRINNGVLLDNRKSNSVGQINSSETLHEIIEFINERNSELKLRSNFFSLDLVIAVIELIYGHHLPSIFALVSRVKSSCVLMSKAINLISRFKFWFSKYNKLDNDVADYVRSVIGDKAWFNVKTMNKEELIIALSPVCEYVPSDVGFSPSSLRKRQRSSESVNE